MTALARYPRLCRGLVTLPDGNALLVDGGLRRHRLTGTAVTTLLPRVLPLLDGTRPTPQIASAAGADEPAVRRLLAVLDGCDLLEWPQKRSGPAPGTAGHVTTYFSRTIGAVDGALCTEQLASALSDTAVLLVADDATAAAMAADLLETGAGEVVVRTPARRLRAGDVARLARAPRRMVAVCDDGGPVLAHIVAVTRGSAIPVLRFASYGDVTETGPVFYDDRTACVRCFRAGYRDAGIGPVGTAPSGLELSGMTAALVTAEIVLMLTRAGASPPPWRLTRVMQASWSADSFDVLPRAGCASCGCAARGAAGAAGAIALANEWQHEIWPEALRTPRIRSRERLRLIEALQHQRDPFPPAPARELDGRLSRAATRLAELLALAGGRRTPAVPGRAMDRWTPSGGNLGSVQLYIAAERDLFGLPGTLFRYDDLGHRVFPVRADHIPLDSLLSPGPSPLDVALIFTASVSRAARKYGDFALRLSHLDTGCAALQLAVAAATSDVRLSFAPAWRPGLPALLELEPGGELVTAIAVVDGTSLEGDVPCP